MESAQLKKFYQALRAESAVAFPVVLADLRQFAMQEPDPRVRCGRLELVNHIDDMLTPEEPS